MYFELNEGINDDDYQNVTDPFTIKRLKCQGKKLQSMDQLTRYFCGLQSYQSCNLESKTSHYSRKGFC